MNHIKRASLAAVAATAVVCAGVALAPAAGAAGAPATAARGRIERAAQTAPAPAAASQGAVHRVGSAAVYGGQCGSGYTVVNSAPVGTLGTVYLAYSAATGNNCVVTVRSQPGRAVYMRALIGYEPDSDAVADSGMYTTYAGPVYLYAPGRCVTWRGEIDGVVAGKDNTNCARRAA